MKEFLKNKWFLLLVLAIFVALKIPHLHYPYYWDESWPYASAIRAMHDAGPGLSPSVIDPELSRGHPLLFHFLASSWMKLFGASLTSMHSFALFIALLCLWALYEVSFRLYGAQAAAIALLFVASREAFFVHSSSVLPEILVGLLALLSLWFYARRKYLLATAALSALFFTKEPGVIVGVVIGLDSFVNLFRRGGHGVREKISRLMVATVPCLLLGAFFLYQHSLRGWFVFPVHAAEINLDWQMAWYKFRSAPLADVFIHHYVYVIYLALSLLAILASVTTKRWGYLAMLPIVILCFYMADDLRCGRLMPRDLFATVLVIVWFGATWFLSRLFTREDSGRFFLLTTTVIFCYLAFSAFNFYTFRYILVCIVLSATITGALFSLYAERFYKWVLPAFLVIILATGIYVYETSDNRGDTGKLSFAAMEVQKSAVEYLSGEEAFDKNITAFSFMHRMHLTDPATGYLNDGRVFTHVTWHLNSSSDYAIFDNLDPDYRYKEVADNPAFQKAHEFHKGGMWVEVYRRLPVVY